MSASDLTIVEVPEQSRFEARRGGTMLGFVDYERSPDRVVLPHTEVDPAYEGQGVASSLARAALEDARQRGLLVDPQCPFVASYIDRHPEFADLVA